MRKPCCEKEGINKGAWSKQEDEKLIGYIKTHGEGCWRSLPQAAGLHRCGKSCRLRWINYLRPDIKRGNFAQDEEDLIIKLHALLGNRWSLIAGRLPGRTDNEVKNYWNSHIRKKLLRMGIDPNNHKPHQRIPPTTTTPFSNQKTTTTNQLLSDPAITPTSSSESLNVVVDQSKPPPPARPVPHHHLGGNRDNNNNNNNDNMKLVSEASISCVDDDTPQALLDLNLDLTIAVPSSPSQKQQLLGDDCDQVQQTDSTTATMKAIQVEAAARRSPTLLLFS